MNFLIRCQCQPGFTGKMCEVDIDECSSSPCQNGGTCEDKIDSFNCICVPGFGGDRCEDGESCLIVIISDTKIYTKPLLNQN